MTNDFHGAKAAVFIGNDLLIYQRDRGVPWPGYWDFPGGGRDGDEAPLECLRREVSEEFAIDLPDAAITWSRAVPSMVHPQKMAWFFVAQLPATAAAGIVFGDEGQRWMLCPPLHVTNMPNLVPALRHRIMLWLREAGREPI